MRYFKSVVGDSHRLRGLFTKGTLRIGKRPRISPFAAILFKRGYIFLGDRFQMRRGAIVDAQGGRVTIGRNVSLNPYSIIYGQGGVTIGDNVRIAAHVVIVSADHRFDDVSVPIKDQGMILKPIVIEDDVWIGAGAKILGGAHVSKGCVIAANAVVKGKTAPYSVYAGVPAKLVRRRDTNSSGNKP